MRHILEEDSLAVLAYLSMCCPRLQGHPSRVQPLRFEQLADVRWQQDVHAAQGAHILPLHKHRMAGVNTNELYKRTETYPSTCRWGRGR